MSISRSAAKSEAEDPQRRLTAEGTETVEQMAEYMLSLRLRVDRIEHSGTGGARQTADIMTAQVRREQGTQQVAGMAPNDDAVPVREQLC